MSRGNELDHERSTKMKEFNLMKSEIKKIDKAFEEQTGIKAYIGAYGFHEVTEDFKDVKVEMDREDNGRRAGTVYFTSVMFDRRRSWVAAVEAEA